MRWAAPTLVVPAVAVAGRTSLAAEGWARAAGRNGWARGTDRSTVAPTAATALAVPRPPRPPSRGILRTPMRASRRRLIWTAPASRAGTSGSLAQTVMSSAATKTASSVKADEPRAS